MERVDYSRYVSRFGLVMIPLWVLAIFVPSSNDVALPLWVGAQVAMLALVWLLLRGLGRERAALAHLGAGLLAAVVWGWLVVGAPDEPILLFYAVLFGGGWVVVTAFLTLASLATPRLR